MSSEKWPGRKVGKAGTGCLAAWCTPANQRSRAVPTNLRAPSQRIRDCDIGSRQNPPYCRITHWLSAPTGTRSEVGWTAADEEEERSRNIKQWQVLVYNERRKRDENTFMLAAREVCWEKKIPRRGLLRSITWNYSAPSLFYHNILHSLEAPQMVISRPTESFFCVNE